MLQFFTIISEKSVGMLHRFGKFQKQLDPGLHFFIPFVDTLEYKIDLKEAAIVINEQQAFTQDNVEVHIGGAIYYKVVDPQKAAYDIADYERAIKNLAMTTMRSELGKIKLDELFQSRKELNQRIKNNLEQQIINWGLECHRYEVLSIDPPSRVKQKMQLEAEAERIKRKEIIQSEGQRAGNIIVAEGKKTADILISEGRAEAIEIVASAEKEGLKTISKMIAIHKAKGQSALNYILSKNYYEVYSHILGSANVTVIPDNKPGESGSNSDLLASVSMIMQANRGADSGKAPAQRIANSSETSKYTSASPVQDNNDNDVNFDRAFNNALKKAAFYTDPSFK